MKRINSGATMLYLILALGAVMMLLPFWVMIITALLSPTEAFEIPPRLWTWTPHWENVTRLFETVAMGRYFLNSVLVAVVVTVCHTVLCGLAAYAFARFDFKFKDGWFFLFLMTLMIPPQVNIVPLFMEMKWLGWLDTYWALIVPGIFGAFGVFLLRQWFMGFPKELEEAAILDGCNPWHIYWKIALPLAQPAVVALGIFVFITQWNSFLWPLIVTFSDELRTLPVGIATLKGSFRDTTDWPLLMAAASVAIVPVIIVFLLAQKQFIAGLTAGGVKE